MCTPLHSTHTLVRSLFFVASRHCLVLSLSVSLSLPHPPPPPLFRWSLLLLFGSDWSKNHRQLFLPLLSLLMLAFIYIYVCWALSDNLLILFPLFSNRIVLLFVLICICCLFYLWSSACWQVVCTVHHCLSSHRGFYTARFTSLDAINCSEFYVDACVMSAFFRKKLNLKCYSYTQTRHPPIRCYIDHSLCEGKSTPIRPTQMLV